MSHFVSRRFIHETNVRARYEIKLTIRRKDVRIIDYYDLKIIRNIKLYPRIGCTVHLVHVQHLKSCPHVGLFRYSSSNIFVKFHAGFATFYQTQVARPESET